MSLTEAAWLAVAAGLAVYLPFALFAQLAAFTGAYRRWRSYGHGRWASFEQGALAAGGNGWIYCCTCPLGKRAYKDAKERKT